MGFEGKPDDVKRAIAENNREALRRMGSAGGKATSINRKEKELEIARDMALDGAATRTESPDGDILPPDPKLVSEIEEVLRSLNKRLDGGH